MRRKPTTHSAEMISRMIGQTAPAPPALHAHSVVALRANPAGRVAATFLDVCHRTEEYSRGVRSVSMPAPGASRILGEMAFPSTRLRRLRSTRALRGLA